MTNRGCEAPPKRSGQARGACVEPVVFAVLLGGETYGYDMLRLADELTEGLADVDPGGLYRTLRRLENSGYVVSQWDETASCGPSRRRYRITDEGMLQAEHWVGALEARARFARILSQAIQTNLDEKPAVSAEGSPGASLTDAQGSGGCS